MKFRHLFAAIPLLFASQAQSAFIVDLYESNSGIYNMTQAESLMTGTATHSGMYDVINFVDAGQSGNVHFGGDSVFPGGAQTTFALSASGFFNIDTADWYTFGVRHDDGMDLNINGLDVSRYEGLTNDRDTFGSVYLDAGLHSLDLGFFEHHGGAHLELFYAAGKHTSFNSGFKLVEAAKVPEPSIFALMGVGLLGLGLSRRRLKK